MDSRDYLRLLKIVGWSLKKSGFDYSLLNAQGNFMCTIKITHGKHTKGKEIPAYHIKMTKRMLEQEGLQWPPKKK